MKNSWVSRFFLVAQYKDYLFVCLVLKQGITLETRLYWDSQWFYPSIPKSWQYKHGPVYEDFISKNSQHASLKYLRPCRCIRHVQLF